VVGSADERLASPGAGREPAASGLIGWLTDPEAPHLCMVTGPSGTGKSHLLAWLVRYGGTGDGVAAERRVHAVAPLAGVSLRGAAWLLADDLRVAARSPDEFVESVAADARRTVLVLAELHGADEPAAVVDELVLPLLALPHVRIVVEARTDTVGADMLGVAVPNAAVMDLQEERWTDPQRFRRWCDKTGTSSDAYPSPGRSLGWEPEPVPVPGLLSLAPETLVSAEAPHRITAHLERMERSGEHLGELTRAWLRSGQSLCREQSAAERAVTLLAAMGTRGEDDVRATLRRLAGAGPWRVRCSRTRDEEVQGWPGPVASLSAGGAKHEGALLLAGAFAGVHVLDARTWDARGRLAAEKRHGTPRTVFCFPEGTVVLLDEWGLLHLVGEVAEPAAGQRLLALVDPDTDPWKVFREAVLGFPDDLPSGVALTAATEIPHGVAFGDEQGNVHILRREEQRMSRVTEQLHDGAVTTVSGIALDGNGPGRRQGRYDHRQHEQGTRAQRQGPGQDETLQRRERQAGQEPVRLRRPGRRRTGVSAQRRRHGAAGHAGWPAESRQQERNRRNQRNT
jgi:hypothetical protein